MLPVPRSLRSTKPYRFPVPRKAPLLRPKASFWIPAEPEITEEEAIGLIQGKVPDSKEEWFIARALGRLKKAFIYQFIVAGGRLRGGIVVDFWIDTHPLPTPLFYDGGYWHSGQLGSRDRFREAVIESEFRGMTSPPIVLRQGDVSSISEVYNTLRRKVL